MLGKRGMKKAYLVKHWKCPSEFCCLLLEWSCWTPSELVRGIYLCSFPCTIFCCCCFEGSDIHLSRELCVGSCQWAHSAVRKGARQAFVSFLGTTSLRALMETQLLTVRNCRDRGAAGCWLMSCWVVLDARESVCCASLAMWDKQVCSDQHTSHTLLFDL